MTFGEFARNYLSPAFLLFRLGWLFVGFAFLVIGALALMSAFVKAIFIILGILLIWHGLRPWSKGMTLKEANVKIGEMKNR